MTFTPAATANHEWGFWGTSVRNGYDAELTWDTASRFLAKHFDLTAEQARDVLDARFGRHLADDLSFIEGAPDTAEKITAHLAERITDKGWRKHFEQSITAVTGKTFTKKQPAKDELFAAIAREHLNIEMLESRNSDSLDFHDVAVWGIQAALEAAFAAGKASAKKGT
ncbi:MAG: hypothetical protein DI582_11200 [Azospirillum brasilense]|nr:MAG: hypothetical protein DI582_11200 [Azospirillum brasilense]